MSELTKAPEPPPSTVAAAPKVDQTRLALKRVITSQTPIASTPMAPKPPAASSQPSTEPTPARPAHILVKRRRDLNEDDLRKQIVKVAEILLDPAPSRQPPKYPMVLVKSTLAEGPPFDDSPLVVRQRADLAGLPMRLGDACQLSPSDAEHLEGGSIALRTHLGQAAQANASPGVPSDTRPDPKKLHDSLNADGARHNKWLRAEAIPALQQLLMAENEAIRDVLVDQLTHIEGKQSSVALAKRALFDLNPDIRKEALESLNKRPVEEFRQTLLDGFRHPWPAVAEHAAEALIALGLKESVGSLLALLDLPDPTEPYAKPGHEDLYVREMVRINHLRNCQLCHAPARDLNDRVRGRVPSPDQPLPPPFSRQYYADTSGSFVRADITYLQQDFSVPLPVKNPGPWPAAQRYDFLVRERPATAAETRAARSSESCPTGEHHQAIFFALRELTSKDPGPTAADWKRLFLGDIKVTLRLGGIKDVSAVAADSAGRLFFSDQRGLWRVEPGAGPTAVTEGAFRSLTVDNRGRLLACEPERVAAIDPRNGIPTSLAERYKRRSFVGPLHLAADRKGGIYFTDAATLLFDGVRDVGGIYYTSAQGVITRLNIALERPVALALAPDEKTLYLLAAGSPEVMAYPLEGAGLPGADRVLCRLEGRSGEPQTGGMAVDARGNLFVANPSLGAVQVFNPQGARLGQVHLKEAPLTCSACDGGRTLCVATRTSVYTLEVGPPS
jgi:sugar lactone lactonase YvrE